MAKYKYVAKEGAPKSTPSPVWAEEVGNTRKVKTGKMRDGSDKFTEASIGDMVYTADLHANFGKVMPKADFDALYERMP